ncbi:hypothetical protein MCN98_08015 [Flavobacteriaceae bacterium LSUCC0859]|nr:hypothetical protein [Flavobacteriaceae bacterium LSUCC0859]
MKIKKFTQIYFALGLLLSSHGLQAQELYQSRKLPKTVENTSKKKLLHLKITPMNLTIFQNRQRVMALHLEKSKLS